MKRFALHDGPGTRTTVFFKGCPMACPWCHNPESRRPEPEPMGEGVVGERVSVDRVMREIEKDNLFYEQSGGGVTFSGGEPLMQPEFLGALLDRCRRDGIHTVLDTTGYAAPAVMETLMDRVDLFLYDVKVMDDGEHRRVMGVSNRRVLSNLETLCRAGKEVVLRFPVIPGITDGAENIRAVGLLAASLKGIRRIDLLAYHRTAAHKYRRLNEPEPLAGTAPPGDERMAEIRGMLREYAGHLEIRRDTKGEWS